MPRTGAVPSSSFNHGVGRNNGVNGAEKVTAKTKPAADSSQNNGGGTRLAIYNPAAITTEATNAQTATTLLTFNKYISFFVNQFMAGVAQDPKFTEFQQKTGLTISDIATSALKIFLFKDKEELARAIVILDSDSPGNPLPTQMLVPMMQKGFLDSDTFELFLARLEPGEQLNKVLTRNIAQHREQLERQGVHAPAADIDEAVKATGIGTWNNYGSALKEGIIHGLVSRDTLHLHLDKLSTNGAHNLLGECVHEAVTAGLITDREKLESYLAKLSVVETPPTLSEEKTGSLLGVEDALAKEGKGHYRKNFFPLFMCPYIRVVASANGVQYDVRPDVNKLFEYEGIDSPKDYGDLLGKLIDAKAITQDEFAFHFQKLRQMCLETQKPPVKEVEPKVDNDKPIVGGLRINQILPNFNFGNIFNKTGVDYETIFDRDGLNMSHSNRLLELQTKAYGAGLVTAKPDIDYHLEFNKINKNSNAVYETVTSALTNGVIKEQGQFDRILETYRTEIDGENNGFLAMGFKSANYADLIMLARKQNVIQDVMPYFERMPEDGRLHFLQQGLKEKYITDLALVDSYLHKLETTGKEREASALLFTSLEAGVHKLDRGSFDELSSIASKNNVPLTFTLAIENLKGQLGLTDEEAKPYYDCARAVFPAVREKNAKAERDDQKIGTEVFELCSSPGLANLLAISEPVTGQILENVLYQRGYLPILKNVFDTVAHLEPEEVQVLNRFCASNPKLVQRDPNFVVDLVGYLQVYKSLDITRQSGENTLSVNQTFEADLCRETDSTQKIARNLGEVVIREICKPERLGLQIDIDKLTKEKDILKEIDMRFLGPLVATRHTWTEQERDVFALLLKSRLEGTHRGLLHPTEYGNYDVSVYGTDEKTQGTVRQIREHNTKLVEEMKAKGLNVEAWLNPNEVVPPVHIVAGVQRRAVKIMEDFQSRFNELKKWMHGGFNTDPHLNSIIERKFREVKDPEEKRILVEGEKVKVKQQLEAMTGRFWKGVEDELKGLLTAKGNNKEKPILHLQSLYSQNQLNPKFKIKHKMFLDTLGQLFERGGMPEAIADMQSIIKEMNKYNPDNKMKGKNYGLRFWDRDPTREFAIGNRAGSCTALGRNSNAIFNFFRDVGTQYIPIVDPENNSLGYSAGEVKGDPVGYSRFWLATNTDDKPIIFIDTVDGMAAGANRDELFEHIIKLAKATGIDVHEERIINRTDSTVIKVDQEGRIIKRKLEPTEKPIKAKIGGFIEGYFHHAQGLMPAEELKLKELQAIEPVHLPEIERVEIPDLKIKPIDGIGIEKTDQLSHVKDVLSAADREPKITLPDIKPVEDLKLNYINPSRPHTSPPDGFGAA